MIVRIDQCGAADIDDWATMRAMLWPDASAAGHREDIVDIGKTARALVGFIVRDGDGAPIAFAEASLRTDYVNGCETTPVAFLEGLFVTEHRRRQGLGRGLVGAVEAWARAQGCEELASDALLENAVSHALHGALDFEETERVVFFRKALMAAPALS